MMYKLFFPILIAVIFSGCTSTRDYSSAADSHQDSLAMLPSVHLPIDAKQWTQWQCPRGDTLRTRYQDSQAQRLIVVYGQREYVLTRQASINPVIYSNEDIGFYSDGRYAAIGKIYSDEVITGGCRAH